tara:strand:- start:39198 stop:39959 length:762 start_codon:yes stop_codon:yes gene_type:complete
VNAERRNWQRDESLLVLHLYCRTPFGKLHRNNPEIIQLADVIGRTPSAVAMKAVNFAHLDPNLNRQGLSSVSKSDRALWEEFLEDSNSIALVAEKLYEDRFPSDEMVSEINEVALPDGPSEARREVSVRRVQGFFRRAVLTSYEQRCAISGLKLPQLLVASHIIPWRKSVERRADPRNGIALNNLYDRAFDEGLLTFDENWKVCLANDLRDHIVDSELSKRILDIEGRELQMPRRFYPDPAAMDYHRQRVFKG